MPLSRFKSKIYGQKKVTFRFNDWTSFSRWRLFKMQTRGKFLLPNELPTPDWLYM